MIARVFVLILLVVVLPEWYVSRRKRRGRTKKVVWKRWLWRLLAVAMVVWGLRLALLKHFVPADMSEVNVFLLVLGLLFVPRAVYVICSALGRGVMRLLRLRYNWGNLVGLLLAVVTFFCVIYGSTIGLRQLCVKRYEMEFADLPAAFDGYKIVLFSDAHVGTFTGGLKKVLQRDIDTINAQKADLIVFAGDLQNVQPSETYPLQEMLSSLRAKDGVMSVLGNHDYSDYLDADAVLKTANERELVSRERQMGWTLLLNDNRRIKRGGASIVIAGGESANKRRGEAPFDLERTLQGVGEKDFVVLLQHDPKAWRKTILPQSNVQLTLSGHTHGGQISLLGFRLTQLFGHPDHGLYGEGGRWLYVTSGIGGLLPFRLGVKPEVVVVTLRN